MDRVIIFDTTLRDGEQAPGFSMNTMEKLEMARQLARLNVDVIEAGFPISSDEDFEATREVARQVGTLDQAPSICGLSRVGLADIDRCWEAVRYAKKPRIHTFVATSDIHLKYKLRKSRAEVMKAAVEAVRHARGYCADVEFSPEDASRSDFDYMCDVLSAVIDAGAGTINIPDTVGYAIPREWGERIASIRGKVHGIEKVVLSVHCHNDLGQAVANSLTAVMNGARQVECTINGLGERAGNASLEEIVMAVKTRKDVFSCDTRIDTTQIVPTSKLVSSITGYPVQPNKAIVGANAFAHESGIHQDGVLKHRETYEIMRAEDVGWGANKLVLGKHSGRNAFRSRLQEIGIVVSSEDQLNHAFARFKELADKKHEIFDEDLNALMSDEGVTPEHEHFRLLSMGAHSETGVMPVARVILSVGGKERQADAQGGGPVDATFKAIEQVVKSETELLLYSVNNITSGTDAQGEVTVRLSKGGRVVNGQGADTDIVVASAKAYLNALNKLDTGAERSHPQL